MEINDNVVIVGLFIAIIALFYQVFKDILSDPSNLQNSALAIILSIIVAFIYMLVISCVSNEKCSKKKCRFHYFSQSAVCYLKKSTAGVRSFRR